MNQEVETLTSSDSQSFFGHLTSEQDIPHTHTLRQISHWKTHTHTLKSSVCVKELKKSAQTSLDERWLNQCLEWRSHLSESRSMTLPSWPQTATPPAALFHSRITRSEPGEWPILTHPPVYKPSSTAFVTGHCTQSSLSYYFITFLTCAGFWLVSSSSVFPNTSASVASRSQQPDAFWRETSCSNRSFWRSGAAEQYNLHVYWNNRIKIYRLFIM